MLLFLPHRPLNSHASGNQSIIPNLRKGVKAQVTRDSFGVFSFHFNLPNISFHFTSTSGLATTPPNPTTLQVLPIGCDIMECSRRKCHGRRRYVLERCRAGEYVKVVSLYCVRHTCNCRCRKPGKPFCREWKRSKSITCKTHKCCPNRPECEFQKFLHLLYAPRLGSLFI